MTSTFFGLTVALRGLMAQRKAIDVTAHNVANANTEGYTRQEAVMKASMPFPVPVGSREAAAGQMGTGVDVDSIRRIRDAYLDIQFRAQATSLGGWETKRDALLEAESIFNEPSDLGVNALINKMWGAWQDLNSNPDGYAAKAAVVQNAGVLTDALRRISDQTATMRTDADIQIATKAGEVNDWLKEIADLNKQIVQVQVVGDQPNDLRDQRDLLLDKLARTVPISFQETQVVGAPDGVTTLMVSLRDSGGDLTLVDGVSVLTDGGSRYILQKAAGVGGALQWVDRDADGDMAPDAAPVPQALDLPDGELAALLELRDSAFNPADSTNKSLAWRLDQLAQSLISEVNGLHGVLPFFTGTGASDIEVNSVLSSDPSQVVAGDPALPGDGSIATSISKLKDSLVAGLGNTSIGDWYKALIARLGIDSKQAQTLASNQRLLVDHLMASKEAMSGVSLDEEAANMIRFERAYQASARVMTAVDEMLDKLINGTGVVGR